MFFVSATGFASAMTVGVLLFSGSLIQVLPHALIAGGLGITCARFVLKIIDADDREQPTAVIENRFPNAPKRRSPA